jgi:hypothetical protein
MRTTLILCLALATAAWLLAIASTTAIAADKPNLDRIASR